MIKLVIFLSRYCLSMSASAARAFTRSDTNQEYCTYTVGNLAEVGVRVSHKSMTKCALQVLDGASASFQRSYGSPVNVIVNSNPYRIFVTRGHNESSTCYVVRPRKTRRKVEDRDS